MAFRSSYILRGSPSQSQSLSFTSTVHENSPFDSEESEATPRLPSRQPTPLSGRSYSVCTEMDIDPPTRATPAAATEVIDLTAEDGPPSPKPPATSPIQSNIASYIWQAANSSGGDHKPVALSAGSDTERVAAGHRKTKSLGKMKVPGGWDEDSESGPSSRAAPVAVGQHTEPSTPASGKGNTTEFEKIYSMLSQLQEVTKIHDKKIKTIDEDYHLLSTRMNTTEDNVKGIDDGFRELSSRIGKAENTFKGIHQGIQQLSTRMGKSESQRREEAKRREKQRKEDLKARQKAEEIHENRFHTLVRLLNVGPAGSTNMETSGFSSSTSYQSDVLSSDMSQHTHSSQNITVPGGRPARLSGYEDPRKPKASRGKRVKNRLGKSRRHSYTPSIGTGTPQSTPPRNIPNSPASNPPGARVIDIVPDIKPETSFSNHSMPSSQHPQSPKREESSHSPAPGSSPEYQPGSQNSAAN